MGASLPLGETHRAVPTYKEYAGVEMPSLSPS